MSKRENALSTNYHKNFDVHFWAKDISVDVRGPKGERIYFGKKPYTTIDQLENIYHTLKQERDALTEVVTEIENAYGKFIYTDKDTSNSDRENLRKLNKN